MHNIQSMDPQKAGSILTCVKHGNWKWYEQFVPCEKFEFEYENVVPRIIIHKTLGMCQRATTSEKRKKIGKIKGTTIKELFI